MAAAIRDRDAITRHSAPPNHPIESRAQRAIAPSSGRGPALHASTTSSGEALVARLVSSQAHSPDPRDRVLAAIAQRVSISHDFKRFSHRDIYSICTRPQAAGSEAASSNAAYWTDALAALNVSHGDVWSFGADAQWCMEYASETYGVADAPGKQPALVVDVGTVDAATVGCLDELFSEHLIVRGTIVCWLGDLAAGRAAHAELTSRYRADWRDVDGHVGRIWECISVGQLDSTYVDSILYVESL